MNWKRIAIAAAIASSIAGAGVYAQQTQPPAQGTGPGMMMDRSGPGYGPGMRGYGAGYGMGPGMMGRSGGMGPGMMGPGMLGRMMGPGMMGGFGLGAIQRLDLDDNQRKQVLKIEDDLRRKNWDVMGKMQDEMSKLRDALWTADKRDRTAVLAANKHMSDMRQQLFENTLDAADKAEAVLNPKQREQLRRLGPWWLYDGEN